MAALWGYALSGMDVVPVRVEAHVRPGLPGVSVVGLPSTSVREARERVRSAAVACGFPLPSQRITVNLSPADLRKEGPGLDLPFALAILAASGYVPSSALAGVGAVGEVALDGLIRPVRGTLAIAETVARSGDGLLLVPLATLREARAAGDVRAIGVATLAETVGALRDGGYRRRLERRGDRWLGMRCQAQQPPATAAPDLADVNGHEHAKRALEIAAAGGHHALLVGSPGSGKTMLARRVPSILPALAPAEALEVTRVWSVAGLWQADSGLAVVRPFRAPHHTASRTALVGGGAVPRPGEVSLAHRGVLFLDELPEFSRDALEALRQPLEEGMVTVSRQGGAAVFPAACSLVAAMNPCPCGFVGHPTRPCRCTGSSLERYRVRLSGPLLDRLDLVVEVPPLSVGMLEVSSAVVTSATVRARVVAAREFRSERETPSWGVSCSLSPCSRVRAAVRPSLEERQRLDPEARLLLREALSRELLGGRGYVRALSVARTIADLERSHVIRVSHVAEALGLRLSIDPGRPRV